MKDNDSLTTWFLVKMSGGNPYLVEDMVNETYKTFDRERER